MYQPNLLDGCRVLTILAGPKTFIIYKAWRYKSFKVFFCILLLHYIYKDFGLLFVRPRS